MKKEQVLKILKTLIVATFLMLVFDVLFSIEPISEFFSNIVISANNTGKEWILYLVIWLLMFIQVCFIPIPAYIVLNASVSIGIISGGAFEMLSTAQYWLYIGVVLSAYMCGAVVAYFIGEKLGSKAVKWCAGDEESYTKWSTTLNTKGKWWYALSVILPIFPDDLLCFVAGAVKFDFKFFFISNAIGRGIGLISMIFVLSLLSNFNSGGVPISLIIWSIALIGLIVAKIVIGKKHLTSNE